MIDVSAFETLMRLTEDLYNVLNGVDYFGAIFSPQPDYDLARKSLIDNITSVPDVIGVNTLTFTIDGEDLNYVAEVATIYGQLTVRSDA